MTFGSIYKIQFPNGKYYIGLTTTSLEQRKKEHKYCAKNCYPQCLYKALRKYNMVDTFELIEIDTAETLEELCEMEIRYITEYNSYYMNGKGYNMTFGGEGINGYVHTEEDKRRASEKTKKQFENPEAIQQSSETTKKYYETHPEAGKEHGEKMKRYYQDNPEARQKQSKSHKTYYEKHPEAKEKMSEIKKKYYECNLDARKKLSDGKGNNIPFDILTIDGTFIKTFTYQFEAREYLQKKYCITAYIKISHVLSGTRGSSYGFVFKYK